MGGAPFDDLGGLSMNSFKVCDTTVDGFERAPQLFSAIDSEFGFGHTIAITGSDSVRTDSEIT